MEDLTGEKRMKDLTQLLVHNDKPAEKKKCGGCGKIKFTRDFNIHKKHKDFLQTWCRNCSRDEAYKYKNSEIGQMLEVINGVFRRAFSEKRKGKKKWFPEISRKGVWQIILNHICRMKEKFPGSNGRLCFYCHQPWTHSRRKTDGSHKHGPYILTNFSLDRFDCRFTYKDGNIVCCCFGCNHRKGNSTPEDWRMFIEAENDLE
jgi:hypothetical protein